ncbi:lipopolysaccharide kinase InaA family protein [Sporosarcina sp. 179-K 3D1 HS]|uniref:protein kinase domain-containing protein n=1 Tax=Sporosarcina sp. 179-K 3D1 HS TaxID=3232169 RepID=UPI00399F7197
MNVTFSIDAENGQELLLVDHYFFYDMLNQDYSADQRKQIEQAIKNYVPQLVADTRAVNPNYKMFIGKYAINALKIEQNHSFKRVINAYLNGYMDFFETESYFSSGIDPRPDDIAGYELEFYRSFVNQMKASGSEQRAVLLTSHPNAERLADRLIDTGLAKVISFSPECGFMEYKTVRPEEGDVVYLEGQPIALGHRMDGGGEADIFELSHGKLAKIYKTVPDIQTHLPNCFKFQQDIRRRNERLDVLLGDPRFEVNDRYIILPQYKLTDANGQLVGIVMDRAEGTVLMDIITKNIYPFEGFKRSDLLTIAKKIIIKMKKLHTHGIIMGDVNLENILVDAKSPEDIQIYIIDLDSCQIEGFPSMFETPEFTDPLWLQERETKGFIPRTIENECFTIAILLFNIIFNNVHPYQHPTGRNLQDNTRKRLYPYKIQEEDAKFIQKTFGVEVEPDPNRNEKKAPTVANYTHSHLPRYLKCMFYATFASQGKDFRPSTTQMMRGIESYIKHVEMNPSSNKMVYDNFAIAEQNTIHFHCSSKNCRKEYYYHYNKVLSSLRSDETYLYCNECINIYDTQIKKWLNDDSLPEKDRQALKTEWEASLNPQNVERLLYDFFLDPDKDHKDREKFEMVLLSKRNNRPASSSGRHSAQQTRTVPRPRSAAQTPKGPAKNPTSTKHAGPYSQASKANANNQKSAKSGPGSSSPQQTPGLFGFLKKLWNN